MAKVEVYRRDMCGFCAAVERLFQTKGVEYISHDIWKEPDLKTQMMKRAGGKTSVPQVFIDGEHIGGCDDTMALEQKGALNVMLGIEG